MENEIELVEKHQTEEIDEENKAMKLFNLEDKKDGTRKQD